MFCILVRGKQRTKFKAKGPVEAVDFKSSEFDCSRERSNCISSEKSRSPFVGCPTVVRKPIQPLQKVSRWACSLASVNLRFDSSRGHLFQYHFCQEPHKGCKRAALVPVLWLSMPLFWVLVVIRHLFGHVLARALFSKGCRFWKSFAFVFVFAQPPNLFDALQTVLGQPPFVNGFVCNDCRWKEPSWQCDRVVKVMD